MPASESQCEAEGIVVGLYPYGESDRVVHAITAEYGRVALFARGARRSKRRFQGALDFFAHLNLRMTPRTGLWRLDSVEVHSVHLGIRGTLDAVARASILAESAKLLTVEQDASVALYEPLLSALQALDAGDLSRASMAYPLFLEAAGLLDREYPQGLPNARGIAALSQGALAGLRGEPIDHAQVAREVERWVVAQIEAHCGRALQSARTYLI